MTPPRLPKKTGTPLFALRGLQTTLALLCLAGSLSHADSPAQQPSALSLAVGEATLTSWNALIEHGTALDERAKLVEVNGFINRSVVYASDRAIWGEYDYWATPAQTLSRGMGDCEDFAIAKYFTLVRMGVPSEKLRLTSVKALERFQEAQAHMVLAYYPSPTAQPLILDNRQAQIKPASERRDLLPVYAFNNRGVFLAKAPQRVSQPAQRLSRWRDVSERALADGSQVPLAALTN
ncbi:transglutaminase-like cysteine peptidase [Pseudomonas sp. 2FG]|uniref:transglutaminase-like cysteine peptidase n=1 Tax=Pseudomonas sp. 2FG TaxID=2502191 RepID=UPI0010FA2409|nr:transglutaminase-like cysteine peptidase [Pseudomonas sp. 2FG]